MNIDNIFKWDYQLGVFVPDDRIGRDCWVSPNGRVFNCTAHEICAEHIVKVFLNEDIECPGDFLIENGWVKFTTSCMNTFYKADGLYDNLTEIQKYIYDNCFNF